MGLMAVRSHWLFLLKSSLVSIELQIADFSPHDIDNIDGVARRRRASITTSGESLKYWRTRQDSNL
jgi:hypothetical protein